MALALAIPLLLAATLGGLRVKSDLDESSNASASAEQVTVLRPAVDYLTAAERAMVAAQSSTGASQTELDEAVEDIKAAAEQLTATAGTAGLTYDQSLQVATLLDLSRSIRDDNTATLSPDTWIAQLRQLQSGVTKLITTITSAQNTPEPRLELLAQSLGGRFSLAMQQALGSDADRSRSVSQALYSELGAESAAIDRLAGALDDAESAVRTLRTNNGERTRAVRTGTSTELGGADAYDEYDNLSETLLLEVDQGLAATATNARDRALFDAALTLGALLAAIALALVISRSLLGPIRKVREGALQVANEDLPDAVARIRSGGEPAEFVAIDVHTHEEIGQLARAVDDLHRQAVTLASGEAQLRSQVGEMFVTLSRRNTTLINQQLNLIEALEKDEEDPKRLESLFRLDHLASRMRRTSDSLLILADAPARSAGWESLSVTEATQAATAGVQDYQRVRIDSTLDSRVGEAAAGDLIHLLTELVDNALSYSSPSTFVTLSTAPAPGGLTIDVSDSGLGIPEESLRQINETLESGADVTPDTARRMGLFVVSRLAKRHGIDVALATNAASGITATVFVPESALRDGAPPMPEAPAEVEPALEEGVEPEQAPFVPEVVSDDSSDDSSGESSETDVDPTTETDEPAASATVIGLPTRQPGSSMADRASATGLPSTDAGTGLPSRQPGGTLAQRGLATGADVASNTPSALNTAAPKPKRGAMPLRSRRAALTEAPSGTDESSTADESAAIASVTSLQKDLPAEELATEQVDTDSAAVESAAVDSAAVETVEPEP
ncbi:ATP-binding protein, partial [Nocardioides sp. P5_C9_2]